MRVQGLSVMVATQRLEEQIMFAWRSWAKSAKFKRHQLLRKSLRCLRVQVKRHKQLRSMGISAIMFKKSCHGNILKQCFDALRQSKEQEKLFAIQTIVEEQEKPMIHLLSTQVDNLREFSHLTMRQRGMKAIINVGRR